MELKEWIGGISNDRGGRVFVLNDIWVFVSNSSFVVDKMLASSITVEKLQEELIQILRYIEKGSHFASIICQSGRRTPLSIEID